ncbi:hypothetical protein [Paraliomyxa miuraensis]|uniref:hypothetical protein n=1 Tax=Paraliomyxa miuraensis TaxID=376150 RepID=UPI00225B168D|nr:hypothetical protein [Paraliomyxa miuraensis]MCX4240235.1 hypothetical protein [Paraliomyxa miuraensis]
MSGAVIRIGLFIGALGLGLACRQPNPEWLGPAVEHDSDEAETTDGATNGTTAETAGTTSGTAGTADTGTTGETGVSGTEASGDDTTPRVCSDLGSLGTGACPAECTECIDGVCHIACPDGACRDELVTCPQGWHCTVVCDGRNSCRDSTIACPGDAACTVSCADRDACREATVTCGAAACMLACSADDNTCRSAAVLCGEADARVSCEEPVMDLELIPGPGSCACEAQGCT